MLEHILDEANLAGRTRVTLTRLAAIALVLSSTCGVASAEVLLESDFSSSDWFKSWQDNTNFNTLRGEPERTNRIAADSTIAGFRPLDGPALQITIHKGENEGTGLSFYPRTVLGHDPSELYPGMGRNNKPNNLDENRGEATTFTFTNTLNYLEIINSNHNNNQHTSTISGCRTYF
jgi:hypothetical protein